MSTTKSNKAWKTFNFDETEPVPNNKKRKEVTPRRVLRRQSRPFDFEQQIYPTTVDDLAVHKRKITDIESWLKNNVLTKGTTKTSSLLLVIGPTGCGKTAAVKVISKHLGIEILEWINPVEKDKDFMIGHTSQLLEFVSVSKYPSLLYLNKPQTILIEDFPNSVIHNPSEFINVLEGCRNSKAPVIFICSDTGNLNLNLPQILFPDDIKQQYSVDTISFNAASNTLLKKALKRAQGLIEEHSSMHSIPDQTAMDNIITSSMGDIRCAVNQFYFACTNANSNALLSPASMSSNKRKRKTKIELRGKNMVKNERLSFFHSLGRVLNPKREVRNGSWRLQCNIEALAEEISIQPTTFNAFIHTNYIKYFGSVDDVCNAADVLSFSERFLNKWENRTVQYGLWIPILGLMVHNEHKVSKWNQITAPRKVKKVTKDNQDMKSLIVVDRCYYDIILKHNSKN